VVSYMHSVWLFNNTTVLVDTYDNRCFGHHSQSSLPHCMGLERSDKKMVQYSDPLDKSMLLKPYGCDDWANIKYYWRCQITKS
jgi:hypothetical protein